MTGDEGDSNRLINDDISLVALGNPDEFPRVADYGQRRYRALHRDFDMRANSLAFPIQEFWDEKVKAIHRENKARIIYILRQTFGDYDFDRKVKDFTEMGVKPFSIIAYHNALYDQARVAFTAGAYYPALVGSCALGERILNHLVLDLRDDFRATPEYRKVYRKSSFDNWHLAIDSLVAWDVLLPDVATEFRKFAALRNRSIHFKLDANSSLRDDALTAIAHLRLIIERQFGTFGTQPWFIMGTGGAAFIKREYESQPFVRRYFLPQCPFVGVRAGFNEKLEPIDFLDYGSVQLTDEEFRIAYNTRDPASVAGAGQAPEA